jgi:dUTPase
MTENMWLNLIVDGYPYLCSATETKVPARGKALVPTDLSIAIPEGTYARIGESSFSLSHFLFVGFSPSFSVV